jgi:glycosyltransferase involved in cell wall biosynthesis
MDDKEAMKLTYGLITWNRFEELQKVIRRVSPHVDRTVVVDGDSSDGSIEWLRSKECRDMNVDVFIHPWQDDFIAQRNRYIYYADTPGWLLTTDTDELLEDRAAYQLRQIVADAEKSGVTLVRFNAHDVHVDERGVVTDNKTNYYEPMLFKLGPRVKYTGTLHHSLHREKGIIRDVDFRYFHVKSVPDMMFHGARNYWHSSKVGSDKRDLWQSRFREMCSKHGFEYFHDLAAAMRAGTVPEEIAKWFLRMRTDKNPEIRAYFNCYYVLLHPERNINGWENEDYKWISGRTPVKGMKF